MNRGQKEGGHVEIIVLEIDKLFEYFGDIQCFELSGALI
jgi:hypothetical protein